MTTTIPATPIPDPNTVDLGVLDDAQALMKKAYSLLIQQVRAHPDIYENECACALCLAAGHAADGEHEIYLAVKEIRRRT